MKCQNYIRDEPHRVLPGSDLQQFTLTSEKITYRAEKVMVGTDAWSVLHQYHLSLYSNDHMKQVSVAADGNVHDYWSIRLNSKVSCHNHVIFSSLSYFFFIYHGIFIGFAGFFWLKLTCKIFFYHLCCQLFLTNRKRMFLNTSKTYFYRKVVSNLLHLHRSHC